MDGSTSVDDRFATRLTALNVVAILRSCLPRRFQDSIVSGPTTSEKRNPSVRESTFAILSSRPPGFSWATTRGSSEPSGSLMGSATAERTNATDSFLSNDVRVSTATSQVTNDPDAMPVFTSSTFTG